ncbi:MAG: peptide ABC transporter substrate-binding protein [Phormidesmis sp.]
MGFRKVVWGLPLALLLSVGGSLLVGCEPRDTDDANSSGDALSLNRAQLPENLRGESVLKLLYGRIPTTLNPHLANGFQDFEAARIVYEPLASYEPDGDLVPVLASLLPTKENGGISEDGRTVTWRLKEGVRWSDGQPFSAVDVVFTYQFVSDPRVAAVTEQYYSDILKVEALDELTVRITFKDPNPSWALPFTGQNGMILPKHIFQEFVGVNARQAPGNLQPVGTGPYRFITAVDGVWTFAANEQFRDGLPAFKIVELEGGVAPYVAARRVLRDGDADFAHNVQLGIRDRISLAAAGMGNVYATFGAYVERLMLNVTDPNKPTEDGERSAVENPHPFFADRQVRRAIDYAIDRDAIANQVYGNAGQRTNQLLPYPEEYANPNIFYRYDPDLANQLLDEAGWIDTNDNGIRDKDGVEMAVVYQTPINPVRQETQSLIKENLEAVGISVDIRRIQPDDFFSGDPSQTRSLNHFYADMQEYNVGSDTPDPAIYMSWWLCDEIASQANQWQKPNNGRYCNEEYDKVWNQADGELDADKRAALFRRLNTILAQDYVVIPLVRRAVTNALSTRVTGVDPTPWDTSTWDIGTWAPVDAPAEEVVEPGAVESEGVEITPVESDAVEPASEPASVEPEVVEEGEPVGEEQESSLESVPVAPPREGEAE